jgi:hypothetical protein
MAKENIEGTATDPNGNPLQDAVIALFLTNKNATDGDINEVQYTRTDSNGKYVIKDHPDADGSSQEWHVAGFYQDGTGEFNALSKPSVEASVGAAIPDSVVSRPQDGSSFLSSRSFGVQISVSQKWGDIGAQLSANINSPNTAEIYDIADGTLMGSADLSALTAGDTFTFGLDNVLQSGDDYNVVVDAGEHGFTDLSLSDYPFTSPDSNLEIIRGGNGTQSTSSNPSNIYRIGDVGF